MFNLFIQTYNLVTETTKKLYKIFSNFLQNQAEDPTAQIQQQEHNYKTKV